MTVRCVMQTEESISGLAAMVKELQEYYSEEKRSGIILKQQEHERKEQHWNGEISQINQVISTEQLHPLTNGDSQKNSQ